MITRGRLAALAVVLTLLLASAVLLLVRSRTPDCGTVVPRPSLPSSLRALGDFDQAYTATDSRALEDAAQRAASAQYPNLIGTTAERPVAVTAANPGAADALVVPLRAQASSAQAAPGLAGLVVFLRDCDGNAFFNVVEDDSASRPVLAQFPVLGRDQAGVRLHSATLVLTYTTSPLQPLWTEVAPPHLSTAAR